MTEVRRHSRITQSGRVVNVRRHHRDLPDAVTYEREGEPETWAAPDDAGEAFWGDGSPAWEGYDGQDDDAEIIAFPVQGRDVAARVAELQAFGDQFRADAARLAEADAPLAAAARAYLAQRDRP